MQYFSSNTCTSHLTIIRFPPLAYPRAEKSFPAKLSNETSFKMDSILICTRLLVNSSILKRFEIKRLPILMMNAVSVIMYIIDAIPHGKSFVQYYLHTRCFVSEISLVWLAHLFDFCYVNNSCSNTICPHFTTALL